MLTRLTKYRYSLLVIAILLAVRISLLPASPPGFYIDEFATQTNVASMLSSQTNARGQSWPLFSDNGGGGFTTPTYLYPLVAWSAMFGDSPLALRAFSEFATIAALLLLAIGLRYWLGTKRALVSAIIGLALPWSWLQGSLAWDPALVPLLVAASFLSLTILLHDTRRHLRTASLFILPLALLALAYTYPPCRVTAPLLYAGAYALLLYRRKISWRVTIISYAGTALVALPLLLFILEPSALLRSGELSVFRDRSILAGLTQTLINLGGLLSPVFLFITGDPNLRHSTGQQGMLGLASLIPMVALLIFTTRRRLRSGRKVTLSRAEQLLLIAIAGVAVSLLGSALTNESQPHSLRATAAWPFFVIVLTLGWSIIIDQSRRWMLWVAMTVFVVSTTLYAIDLYQYYPTRASAVFNVHKNP